MEDQNSFGGYAPGSQVDLFASTLYPEQRNGFGGYVSPTPRPQPETDFTRVREARMSAPLIDGTYIPQEELEADKYGAQLMAVRSRTTKYGFKDALVSGNGIWDFVPFMGMFASAAHDLSAARDASNAFQKLLRNEPLTRDEAIRATLWREEQEMRADGTWGALFGQIVRQAPAFMVEFGALGKVGQAVRSGVLSRSLTKAAAGVTEDVVDDVARYGATRAVKRAAVFEYAPTFVKDALESEVAAGRFATKAAAAEDLLKNPVAIEKLTETTAKGVRSVMDQSAPELTQIASWAPGLADRVATRLADRAVRAELAAQSNLPAWSRWFRSAGLAVKDSFAEGLIDLGAWGSERSSVLTTAYTKASRAFAQAALDFTIGAGTRGALLFGPRELVTYGAGRAVEAATGNAPVRENTLSLQYDAWRQNNPDLMDRAETYGMFLDLLEYVSENSGRGFTNFMRGAGLAVAPKLMRPASKIAGLVESTGATRVVRDSAGKVTDVVSPVGFVDAASSAEVGGILSRYVGKVLGGRNLREGLSERKLNAVVARLEAKGIHVADKAALTSTIENNAVDRALAPEIAAEIGDNVRSYVNDSVAQALGNRSFLMKSQALAMYYAADFAMRRNLDAQQVYEAFTTMGYNGVVAEMFEERYIDVVKELFGLDAKQAGFGERLATAFQRLFWPEGGLKQLAAEALGFAVPGVARAGAARIIAAAGTPNDYARHNAWSANIGDLLKYGSSATFSPGDYAAQVDAQIRTLKGKAQDQRDILSAGQENGVPLTELRKSDLEASIAGYEKGAVRAEQLRRAFLASLGDATGESFSAPVYSDAKMIAGDFEFERTMHMTARQARRSLDLYKSVISYSPIVAQTQYKESHPLKDEPKSKFRRMASWVAEHVARAVGFASTGEIAFLSAKPSAFALVDRGVDPFLLSTLSSGYARVYEPLLERRRHDSPDGTVDTDAVHAEALGLFRPDAEAITSRYLAGLQVHAFANEELHDIALAKVAEDEGYVVDARARSLVGKDDLSVIGFDDFQSRPGIESRIAAEVEELAKVPYSILVAPSFEQASADVLSQEIASKVGASSAVRDILRIPKGLPTASQAILAAAYKYSPAFAGSAVELHVDPLSPVTTQIPGTEAYADVLKAVTDVATEGRPVQTPEDVRRAVERGIANVDQGALEVLGRSLGYGHDFTEKGLRERNAKVVRYALEVTALDDPNKAVFARSAVKPADDGRFSFNDNETVVAVFNGFEWVGEFKKADGSRKVVRRATKEGLAEEVAKDEYGYAPRRNRVIHTPVRLVYADSAYDMVMAVPGAAAEYRERMENVQAQTRDPRLLDPLLRKNEDGSWMYDEEEADAVRREEAARAEDWRAHGGQHDNAHANYTLWLRQGESASDADAVSRAKARMEAASDAWFRREQRQDDGRALGYNSVAADVAEAYGARGGASSRFEDQFSVADPATRNRYTLALSALGARTGDVYVHIDHGTAQSYGSSLLDAAVKTALLRSYRSLARMFRPYVSGFLKEVEGLVNEEIRKAQAPETRNPDAERRWRAFGDATVFDVKDNSRGSRKASIETVARFIEAFCLYRTEVPDGELGSTLGQFAPQYKALAGRARNLQSYIPFCAYADLALGGNGFSRVVPGEDASFTANSRGLAFYYALFAPGSRTLAEAVDAAKPNGADAAEFVSSLREKVQAAFRTAAAGEKKAPRTAPLAPVQGGDRSGTADVEPARPADSGATRTTASAPRTGDAVLDEFDSGADPYFGYRAARAVMQEEAERTGVEVGPEEAEEFASILGGVTKGEPADMSDAVEPGEFDGLFDETDEIDEWDDQEDSAGNTGDEQYSVQPAPVAKFVLDENGEPVRADYRELKALTDDEVRAFSGVVSSLVNNTGVVADATDLESAAHSMLRRLAPSMSDEDRKKVVDTCAELGWRYVGSADWVWAEDKDEDGLKLDGYESDSRNAEVLKSVPVRRMLAIVSRISPATGRDFQPFVEDMRSFVTAAPDLLKTDMEANPVLTDAVDYLARLLNPRANNEGANACARDAMYADLVDMMDPPRRGEGLVPAGWSRVRGYIAAFAGKDGQVPPCARAAVLLAHLSGLPANIRRLLLNFISNSAPADPCDVKTSVVGGRTKHVIVPVPPRPGNTNMESMTAVLSRFAGRTPAELEAAADRLESLFRAEIARAESDGSLLRLVRPLDGDAGLQRVARDGLFDVYARVFSSVLGTDNPLVAAFVSRRLAVAVRTSERETAAARASGSEGPRDRFFPMLEKFAVRSGKSGMELPWAMVDLLYAMRAAAKSAEGGFVSAGLLEHVAVSTFQSGSPQTRHVHWASASLMGRGAWAELINKYSEAKPVTIMRAHNDEARSSKPESSIAITMPGIESVLQQFLDRPDDRGFEAVCRKYFPDRVKHSGFDLGVLRQRLTWPDEAGTGIVAKITNKTAMASEVRAAAKEIYDSGTGNILYVKVFAGDHTSYIVFKAPIADQLRKAKMTYEQAERMVNDWLGLDMFGVSAKRTSTTSLEAPSFSLVGMVKDDVGSYVLGDDGKPKTGVVRVAVIWDPVSVQSDEAAKKANEAMKGSLGLYGHGARRAFELARDPACDAVKIHIQAVGPESNGTTMPQITKALVTAHAQDDGMRRGKFIAGGPMRTIQDLAEKLCPNPAWDSVYVTDADSVKLDIVNNPLFGVKIAGETRTFMDFVLNVVLAGSVRAGVDVSDLSGEDFDKYVAGSFKNAELTGVQVPEGWDEMSVPVTNDVAGTVEWVRLSEYLPGASIAKSPDGRYAFVTDRNNLMGFQAANVAHKAKASTDSAPRNHATDLLALSTVLPHHNSDAVAGTHVLNGVANAAKVVNDIMTGYGIVAAAMTSDEKSLALALEDSDDWQALKLAGIPPSGPLAREIRHEAYAAWANDVKAPPMRRIPAALVSSGAWRDKKTGEIHCPGASAMYLDTVQGAKTIPLSQRGYWRAAYRPALMGVNSLDMSFRHGLYIDEDGLLGDSELAEFNLVAPEFRSAGVRRTKEERVVETVESIVRDIVSGCSNYGETEDDHASSEKWLRFKLGLYLKDHLGNSLSARRVWSPKQKEWTTLYDKVGYLDLLTRSADANGNFDFDRAAIYTGMHDHAGEEHMYLGGTKFAFTRTPSGNAKMVVARAGLPVETIETEHEDETGAKVVDWQSGPTAWVSADPDSLDILGNDNDGDKSNLYVLAQRDGHLFQGDDGGLFVYDTSNTEGIFASAEADAVADTLVAGSDKGARRALVEHRRWLVEQGILAREKRRETGADGKPRVKEGKLALAPLARDRVSNSLVLGWFDMSAALPVPATEESVPIYSGTVSDGSNPGNMLLGVKAAPASPSYGDNEPPDIPGMPEHVSDKASSWSALEKEAGVLGEELLDIKDPDKWIANGAIAAAVEDGAALVSAARARFVAAARNLQMLWAVRAPAGLAREVFYGMDEDPAEAARRMVDALVRIDGPSNMSFDDMKGQKCSRVGLWPGMVDTFIAEYMILNGGIPRSDADALKAVAAYAKKVNDPSNMYHYMLRASNPADTEFQDYVFGLYSSETGVFNPDVDAEIGVEESGGDLLFAALLEEAERRVGERSAPSTVMHWLDALTDTSAYSPNSGAYAYLRAIQSERPELLQSAVGDFADWLDAVSYVGEANSVASAVNYMLVDPNAPNAKEAYDRRDEVLAKKIPAVPGGPTTDDDPPMLGTKAARRMFAATQLLASGGGFSSAYSRGAGSVAGRKAAYVNALASYAGRHAAGHASAETMFLVSYASAPKLAKGRPLSAANNARMVGPAAAAFLAVPQPDGSVFNDTEEGMVSTFRKCSMFAEAASSARHPVAGKYGDRSVHANVTLDFCWAVESMMDILSRFVSTSGAHRAAPLADFFRELPTSGARGFAPSVYGPSAENQSRITLALPDMTRDQLVELQDMVARIVSGRILDTNGAVGKKPYASYTFVDALKGGKPRETAEPISFAFSAENMKRMLKYSQTQTGAFSLKVDKKAVASGTQRDIQKDLKALIAAFEHLSKTNPKDFPPGFSIQPSALVGQLLPIYASITGYVDGVPGPGTRSLSAAFPDVFAVQQFLAGQMYDDPAADRYLSLAESIDYGAVPAYRYDSEVGGEVLRSLDPRSALASRSLAAARKNSARLGEELATAGDVVEKVSGPAKLSGYQPRPVAGQTRPYLGIFDGSRGVAFEALVNIMATHEGSAYSEITDAELAGKFSAVPRGEEKAPAYAGYAGYKGYAKKAAPQPRVEAPQPEAKTYSEAATEKKSERPPVVQVHKGKWTRASVETDKDRIYLFGDNVEDRDQALYGPDGSAFVPKSTQAVIRGLPNAIGIVTKKDRRTSAGSYFTDADFENFKQDLDTTLDEAVSNAKRTGRPIVLPEDGIGTGAAQLEKRAPRLFKYLQDRLSELRGTTAESVAPQLTEVDPQAVRTIAQRMAQVFKLWNGAKVTMDPSKSAFTIHADFDVDPGDPDARVFKTAVRVKVTNGGLPARNRAAALQSVAARANVPVEKLEADPAYADELLRRYPVSGVTTFRFEDSPVLFSVSPDDLGVLVADVTLDAPKAVMYGVGYHEAFHAVMGFARAAGVLSEDDVKALQKQFGKATRGGYEWFDEEKAAEEFRRIVHASAQGAKDSGGVLDKIFAFVKALVEALGEFVGGVWSRNDYSRPLRSNPILGVVLTGQISTTAETAAERASRMDLTARFADALRTANLQEGWGMDDQALGEATDKYAASLQSVALVLENTDASRLQTQEGFVEAALETPGAVYGDWNDETERRELAETIMAEGIYAYNILDKYGPRVVEPASDAQTPATVVPNEEYDPSFAQPPEQDVLESKSSPDEFSPEDAVDGSLDDLFDEQYAVAPELPKVRDALRSAGIRSMAAPYGELDARAQLVGALLRGNPTESERKRALALAEEIAEGNKRANRDNSEYAARVDAAIERVKWLYGTVPDPAAQAAADTILKSLAAEGYSTAGQSRQSGPVAAKSRSQATRASLAAAVAATSGTLPGDILEAALYDLREIRDRRGADDTLSRRVLDGHLIPALERLYAKASDPTGLLKEFDPAEDEGPTRHDPHDILAFLNAGIDEERDASGRRTRFVLADGESDNPYHADNVRLYADHVEDPDFQKAIGIALDAVYMVAASRRMYDDLGFRPGTMDEAIYVPGALSPAEMAADLNAAPEQYEDPGFSATFDGGWVTSVDPQVWLDSILRPSFGNVGLRDALQNSHRAVGRFKLRAGSISNLHAMEYGANLIPNESLIALAEHTADGVRRRKVFSRFKSVSDLPAEGKAGVIYVVRADDGTTKHYRWDGRAYSETLDAYDSGFAWRDTGIERRGERDANGDYVRAYDNYGKTRATDVNGDRVVMTRNDIRQVDLVFKARGAFMSGARKLVTGVDELTFSPETSHDPADYTREKVEARRIKGYAGGETDFDKALNRLDIQLADSYGEWFDWIVDSGPKKYGLRDALVDAACKAMADAKALLASHAITANRFNDYVIGRLDRMGLVSGVQAYSPVMNGPMYVSAAVALDVDRIEELFLQSDAYKKLVAAGRKPEWLTREAYLKPYYDLVREMRAFAGSEPFVGRGAGRFFHGVVSPLPFSGGDGVTIYGLTRKAEVDPAKVASEVRTSFADAFEANIGSAVSVAKAPENVVLMAREVFHLPAGDVVTTRARLARGDFRDVRGLDFGKAPDAVTVGDLVGAVAQRLNDMVFNVSSKGAGAQAFGGVETVKELLQRYREASVDTNAPVGNVAGLAPDVVHRMTGRLPANFQLGHAVENMADGLANALAYRASLVAMVTTPDADGMPLCYAKPALDAGATTGVPDAVWGAVARWWAELHGLRYDGMLTGVENARVLYDEIVEHRIDKSQFGSINPEDMDDRTIDGFWARKGVPDGESRLDYLAGGYALGYAKHLFRSTKGLGPKWQRATVHRVWAYSKAMSVSFSLFFPLATRIESPVGAVGMFSTVAGNLAPGVVRRNAKALNKIFNALGTNWITADFTGEKDFAKLLDSNDPFLSDMYDFASAVGLTLSTAELNPEEHSRGILQQDLRNLVEFVRAEFGDSAAKKVSEISSALFTRSSEKAFQYHLNATKLAVAAQLCMKLRAEAEARGIAFDPVRDMRRYTAYVNAEIGGIDPLQYAWAHPGMQNLMNSTFFSWQWTRGAWEAGGGKIIEQVLFGGHDATPEERRFIIGRAMRMYGWIAFGVPVLLQVLSKALGWALDPDHEDRDDEPWWIWQNEGKANMKAFDLTPLMRGMAKRFPKYAEWRGGHRVLAALPAAAFMLTKRPWLALAALPVYTGSDTRNTTELKHYYMHFGKQVWEFNRWFDQPFAQFVSKLAMPIQRLTEGVLGRSLAWQDHALPWANMGDVERWLSPTKDSAIVNLGKAFLPFSFTGLLDLGDAGLLPTLGPVSLGEGGMASVRNLKDDLGAWVTNDRRGFRINPSPGRSSGHAASMRRFRSRVGANPVLWRHVSTMLANGYSEDQAMSMVDKAVGELRSERYRKLESLLPETPDGDYDVKEWSKTVRELQKLGLLAKDVYDALVNRLGKSNAWKARYSAELDAKIREMVREAANGGGKDY